MVNHPNRSKRATSSFPLDWHRTCLANSREHLARQQQQLERLRAELQDALVQTEFYAVQIEEAERKGLVAFDRERLLIKRNKVPAAT